MINQSLGEKIMTNNSHSPLPSWIQTALGRAPGAYWMIVLWTALAVDFINVLALYPPFIINTTGATNQDVAQAAPTPDWLSSVALPIAVLAAAMHWLTTRPAPVSWGRRVVVAATAAIFAGGLYLAPANLLFLPGLFGLAIPAAVSHLERVVWPAIALLVTFGLVAGQRYRLSFIWKALIVGSAGGAALVLILAYPVYTLAYSLLISDTAYTGSVVYFTGVGTASLGILLALAIGPLAVSWSQVRGQKRLLVGALVGGTAGAFLFGGLGGPVAGLVAQLPLYGVALTRTGYSAGEFPLKLVLAVNAHIPTSYGAFWLLFGGGALIGALTGFLTPALTSQTSAKPAIRPLTKPILWPVTTMIAMLALLLLSVVNVAIFLLLGNVLQNNFDLYGFRPSWQPDWSTFVVGMQPWLAYIVIQAGGLLWLHQAPARVIARGPVVGLTLINGLLNLTLWPLILYAMNQAMFYQFWSLAPILVMMLLGLEMVVMAGRGRQPAVPGQTTASPDHFVWGAAGVTGGLLAALFIHQSFTAVSLNLLRLALPMVAVLAEESASPAGLAWLDQLINPLFATHFALFFATCVILAAAGAYFSSVVKSAYWFWQLRGHSHLPAIRQGGQAWLLTVLFGSASVVLIVWLARGHLTDKSLIVLAYALVALTIFFPRRQRRPWGTTLLGVNIAAVIAIGGTFIPLIYFLIFTLGLVFSQRRFIEPSPWPKLTAPLLGVGRVMLIMAMGYLLGGHWLAFFVLTVAVILGATQPQFIKRLPWPWLALAFGLSLACLVTVALNQPYRLVRRTPDLWTAYLLLTGLTTAITYGALRVYTPPALRLAALPVVILLAWLMVYADQTEIIPVGGVSRYDAQSRQWEHLALDNSVLDGQLNYQFFADSRNRLWIGSGTGFIARYAGGDWRTYLSDSASSVWHRWHSPRIELISDEMKMLEDKQGGLWVASKATFGRLDPDKPGSDLQIIIKDEVDESSSPLSQSQLKTTITDMAFDSAGNLWLATAGHGVLRLAGGSFDPTRRAWFTAENSNLPSDEARVIHIGQSGEVWVGTALGLSRFNGKSRQAFTASDGGLSVTALLEDSKGRLWVGATSGGYLQGRKKWYAFGKAAGWPNGLSTRLLFEDSQGGIWAGTSRGALRFDGHRWRKLGSDLYITALAEGPPGQIWIGSQSGLVRYDLETGMQEFFDANNSDLASDWVRDLHVDQDNRLWVSTFSTRQSESSPWVAIGVTLLFFGYLFANAYRGIR